MAQLFLAVLVVSVAMFAIKVAVLLMFLIGIIWRPKATLSLIVVLGVMALLRNYPKASLAVGGLAALVALARLGDDDDPPGKAPDA